MKYIFQTIKTIWATYFYISRDYFGDADIHSTSYEFSNFFKSTNHFHY